MIRKLLISLILFTNFCVGQEIIHYSQIRDEHTIQEHFTRYIANLVGSIEYQQEWDDSSQVWKSYIPKGLTYEMAANKTLNVECAELNYSQYYKLYKPELISVKLLDSIFNLGRNIEVATLNYDSLGRLRKMSRISKKYRTKEKQDVTIDYIDTLSNRHLNISIKKSSFNFFANYRSIYVGRIIGRPLRLRSEWKLHYVLDSLGIIRNAVSSYEAFANGRVNTKPGTTTYQLEWDKKGRLLKKVQVSTSDTTTIIHESHLKELPFKYEESEQKYELLKVPQIKRWVQSFDASKLSFVEIHAHRNEGTYLMYNNQQPLIFFGSGETPYLFIYDVVSDSMRTDNAKYQLSKIPDITDSSVYDPHYKSHVTEVRYTQCSVETYYSRPPGLMNAARAEAARKIETPLQNGWKLIKYTRGSDGYTRFALGYPARIRHDDFYAALLIVDENNFARYYYKNKKLYKISEQTNLSND